MKVTGAGRGGGGFAHPRTGLARILGTAGAGREPARRLFGVHSAGERCTGLGDW